MSLSEKTKMRIRTAVRDYQTMFPQDLKNLMQDIEYTKANLKSEYAEAGETRGGSDMRLLYVIDEKLSTMIALKLTNEEQLAFRERENNRWFAKEFPQFAISKAV